MSGRIKPASKHIVKVNSSVRSDGWGLKPILIKIGVALPLVVCVFPTLAVAGPLDSDIESLATDIANTLEGLGQNQVLIGQFVGPSILQGSGAGPGIAKRIADKLNSKGITVSRNAKYAISGRYRQIESSEGRPQIEIVGEYELARSGEKFGKFRKILNGKNDAIIENLAVMFGVTSTASANLSTIDREKALLKRIAEPLVFVEESGHVVSASANSPYKLELLGFNGNIPPNADPSQLKYERRIIQKSDQQATTKLKTGEYYALQFSNKADHAVAVSITIDGLNMFVFSPVRKSYVIVEPKGQAVIYGWFRSLEETNLFQTSEYADSAAKEHGLVQTRTGLITVTVRAAWTEGSQPPHDELRARLLGARGKPLATTKGPPVPLNYKVWQGHVGVVRETISIRYNR